MATEKFLAKITSVKFGTDVNYPFLYGLQLTFESKGGIGVGCGGKYLTNMKKWDEYCKFSPAEQQNSLMRATQGIIKLMEEAGVNDVYNLLNKPVEVTVKDNCFESFRILTEVL